MLLQAGSLSADRSRFRAYPKPPAIDDRHAVGRRGLSIDRRSPPARLLGNVRQESARHPGHLDIVCEPIKGSRGE